MMHNIRKAEIGIVQYWGRMDFDAESLSRINAHIEVDDIKLSRKKRRALAALTKRKASNV